jgi:cytochrome c oxidase assembly protein subunit 15
VLLALAMALRLTDAPARQRAGLATIVLGVGLVQGLIGYVQYATGLPVVAVALHMLRGLLAPGGRHPAAAHAAHPRARAPSH